MESLCPALLFPRHPCWPRRGGRPRPPPLGRRLALLCRHVLQAEVLREHERSLRAPAGDASSYGHADADGWRIEIRLEDRFEWRERVCALRAAATLRDRRR